ncbi:hypothetical protein Emag_000585 [Eimeria magna]
MASTSVNLMQATAEDMFALLKQYGVRLAVEDSIQLENLLNSASDFERFKLLDAAEHISRIEALEDAPKCFEKLKDYQHRIDFAYGKAKTLRGMRELLIPDPSGVLSKQAEATFNAIKPKVAMWENICLWQADTAKWLGVPLVSLHAEEVEQGLTRYLKEACVAVQAFPDDPVALEFKKEVEKWRSRLPLVLDLGNPALKRHHWANILEELKQLDQKEALQKRDFINEISTLASVQQSLSQTLEKIVKAWENRELLIKPFEEDNNAFIIRQYLPCFPGFWQRDLSDLLSMLEDHQISMQRMLHNPYVDSLKETVEAWAGRLDLAQQVVEELAELQCHWIGLQSIFSNAEAIEQLPDESEAFEQADGFWRAYLRRVRGEQSNILTVVEEEGLLDILAENNKILASVQRKLEDYVDTKRSAFPRFCFLSSEELLKIISKPKQPAVLQESLQKCFGGLHGVTLGPNGTTIEGLHSSNGEKIGLLCPVNCSSPVEDWFADLERAVSASLRHYLKTALEARAGIEDEEKIGTWLPEQPAQCAMTATMITWCSRAEAALTSVELKGDVASLCQCVSECNREIEQFRYRHEYLGSGTRLVITPLTAKCFMTLTSALHLGYGGAPAGPAGSGRMELPGNLKSLFRPVSMVVPDFTQICEVLLFASGFLHAKTLAKKVVQVFSTSATLLSQQSHYDWGLRAMKTVLLSARNAKEKQQNVSEEDLVIQALHGVVPRLISDDVPIFSGIVAETFPQQRVNLAIDNSTKIAIEEMLQQKHLQAPPSFVERALQLYETQLIRHGILLVGAPGVGKTTLLSCLSAVISRIQKTHESAPLAQDHADNRIESESACEVLRVNPKALQESALFGRMDPSSKGWLDGIVSADLGSASPATVSRCGTVFIEPGHLGYLPLLHSWRQNFEVQKSKFARLAGQIEGWCAQIVQKALPCIRNACTVSPAGWNATSTSHCFAAPARQNCTTQSAVQISDSSLVASVCRLLNGLMPHGAFSSLLEDDVESLARMNCVIALAWGLGAHLNEAGRVILANALYKDLQEMCKQLNDLDSAALYDLIVDEQTLSFRTFDTMLQQRQAEQSRMEFDEVFVPTTATLAHRHIIDGLVHTIKHIFNHLLSQSWQSTLPALCHCAAHVIEATVNSYESIKTHLLPTPLKCHYNFSLRDVAKATEAMLMADSSRIASEVDIAREISLESAQESFLRLAPDRLWLHEMQRQFGDRLVTIEDRKWTERLLMKQVAACMQVNNQLADLICSEIMFGDFAQMGEGRTYVEISMAEEEMNALLSRQDRAPWLTSIMSDTARSRMNCGSTTPFCCKIVSNPEKSYPYIIPWKQYSFLRGIRYLEQYNAVAKISIDIVFFEHANKHIARLCRILRIPGGNALLLGANGSGPILELHWPMQILRTNIAACVGGGLHSSVDQNAGCCHFVIHAAVR